MVDMIILSFFVLKMLHYIETEKYINHDCKLCVLPPYEDIKYLHTIRLFFTFHQDIPLSLPKGNL